MELYYAQGGGKTNGTRIIKLYRCAWKFVNPLELSLFSEGKKTLSGVYQVLKVDEVNPVRQRLYLLIYFLKKKKKSAKHKVLKRKEHKRAL